MNAQPFCFVEQSEFALRLAAGVRQDRKLRIDGLQEFVPGSPGTDGALKAVTATAGVTWWRSLRPKSQRVHLASASEANQYRGATGIQAWLRLTSATATAHDWCVAADAGTGLAPAAGRWVAVTAAGEAYEQSLAPFAAAGSTPAGSFSGTLLSVGAVATSAGSRVLVLELGEATSFALVVDHGGLRAAAPIGLQRGSIAAAVQGELGLKFRGAADKLFFNPDYDFADVAAKIAARLLSTLKPELDPLLTEWQPAALYCSLFGARQQWLTGQLAAALGLPVFNPDTKAWCASAGIEFAGAELATMAGPGWLPVLRAAQALVTGSPASWQGEWRSADALAAVGVTPPVVIPPPKPVEAAKPPPPPAPSKAPAAPATPRPAEPAPKIAPKPAAPAAPAKVPGKTEPAAPAKKPIAPFPLVRPPTEPPPASRAEPAGSSVAYPAKPERAKEPSSTPAPTPAPRAPGGQRSKLLLIGVAAAVVLVVLAGLFFRARRNAEVLAVEKQKTEQRLQAEQERARLAEQKAREAAEERGKTERELSEKLKAAEEGRAEAQKEALAQAAARLANARGSITITTQPAGATVALGSFPPRPSPATFTDIKTGRYEAVITLAGYDEAKLPVEVLENTAGTAGTVTLVRALGSLEIATQPAGVDYEVKPAHVLLVAPDARRTGRTPVTIDDLVAGDYVVTLTRDGWAPHSETVTVARTGTARVNWSLPTGLLRVTSTPAGATIQRNGQPVGTTPLELKEQPTGAVEFELRRPEYDLPVVLKGEILPGEVLELNGAFSPADRIYGPGEFDREPEAGNDKPPVLPYYLTLEKGRIEIELIVLSDGTTKGYRVRQTTNGDYAKYCFDALKKWKFKPATLKGRPVNARIVVPFTFKGSNG
jgi:hypothetical protein